MKANKRVSIIIPAYNRAHLIGETLESILAQTYANWECIIVDDGSTDNTVKMVSSYVANDNRFKLFERPNTRLKGANTCRNIGLEQAQGDYVVFFDSDDLMTPDHLETKIQAIEIGDFDYCITKTEYFNYDTDCLAEYYKFDTCEITPYNYVSQMINWLTLDVCIKVSIAKSISFNENLQSGQEYNYYCKLVHKSVNASFIDKVVSLRRHHEQSIRAGLDDKFKLTQSYCRAKWHTYLDIKHQANKETRLLLLCICLHATYKERQILVAEKKLFYWQVFKELGIRGMFLGPMLWSYNVFGKGYVFRKELFKAFPDLP
ncbi:glycosyltransferase family 2 protein [Mangrovimonas yunxiaonensis]|uniref:glycosyltransferase family 2 protein n=1 Tax=Mangrovimonas yunxiaonensis TaxID=1197477 RepID=UPI0006896F7A|nr:glycosyltransferase family 2 protein [Mangrovimonas yunxiaonensis]GGH46026.1 glycosyl transferase [Mangrovimonas yunxiaonensis]